MDITKIRRCLPHRYPFLLIDRVVELNLPQSIVAYKNVSVNEPFFSGHFPDKSIMPGVLVIEAMAQSAGILGINMVDQEVTDGSLYLFVGADNVRFKRQVVPGDQLFLQATYVSNRCDIWKFECRALVDEKLVASAHILCAHQKAQD